MHLRFPGYIPCPTYEAKIRAQKFLREHGIPCSAGDSGVNGLSVFPDGGRWSEFGSLQEINSNLDQTSCSTPRTLWNIGAPPVYKELCL